MCKITLVYKSKAEAQEALEAGGFVSKPEAQYWGLRFYRSNTSHHMYKSCGHSEHDSVRFFNPPKSANGNKCLQCFLGRAITEADLAGLPETPEPKIVKAGRAIPMSPSGESVDVAYTKKLRAMTPSQLQKELASIQVVEALGPYGKLVNLPLVPQTVGKIFYKHDKSFNEYASYCKSCGSYTVFKASSGHCKVCLQREEKALVEAVNADRRLLTDKLVEPLVRHGYSVTKQESISVGGKMFNDLSDDSPCNQTKHLPREYQHIHAGYKINPNGHTGQCRACRDFRHANKAQYKYMQALNNAIGLARSIQKTFNPVNDHSLPESIYAQDSGEAKKIKKLFKLKKAIKFYNGVPCTAKGHVGLRTISTNGTRGGACCTCDEERVYYQKLLDAIPKWLDPKEVMKAWEELGIEADRRYQATGIRWHRDHIHALKANSYTNKGDVKEAGTHEPDNWQLLPADQNMNKSNHTDRHTRPAAEAIRELEALASAGFIEGLEAGSYSVTLEHDWKNLDKKSGSLDPKLNPDISVSLYNVKGKN